MRNLGIEILGLGVLLAGSIALASCGSSGAEHDRAAIWPSCSWPAALDPDPSGSAREHCVAARTRLSCSLPGGGEVSCWTNDPTQCEGGNPPGAENCHAECAEDEFSARCGDVGPGSIPDPPAGCRFDTFLPSGVALHCCPCGA
ncbi:MAG TPA: hypothetical protein VHW23_15000 [Kofleriaceae bacterium]|nr:hypothetical protein [Kofleriaceae bacterium]